MTTHGTVRVAINGFGRVGRCFLRSAHEREAAIEVVAINDVTDPATLAHLFGTTRSTGASAPRCEATPSRSSWTARGSRSFSEPEPGSLPWSELGVDLVIESTGRFRTRAGAQRHIDAGARKVIITAPAKGDEPVDANVVLGVNFHEVYDPDRHHIVTNASCTTNCLAPVAKVLHETVGIRHGLMTTVHAYTADQKLLDGPHKDLRRARAAGINLVPTSTGAAKAVGLVIPELEGKLHGYAVRVPLPTGSLVDLTVESERPTTVDEVNAAFAERADSGELEGILAYSEEPLVATDIIRSDYSAVFDAPLTAVIDGTQVKVVAWYDNEWGYSTRLVDLAERAFAPVPSAV